MNKKIVKNILCLLMLLSCLSIMVEGAVKNCNITLSTDKNKCQTCNTNFIPTVDRTKCVSKLTNCDFANNASPTTCANCTSGFVISSTGNSCQTPLTNCLSLDDTGKCLQCATNLNLTTDRTKCLTGMTNCLYLNNI